MWRCVYMDKSKQSSTLEEFDIERASKAFIRLIDSPLIPEKEVEKENLTELDPANISPWHHRVAIQDNTLVLVWRMADGHDRIRCFTKKEMRTLLKFLNDHSIEILKDL